jgi:hypothetical protein
LAIEAVANGGIHGLKLRARARGNFDRGGGGTYTKNRVYGENGADLDYLVIYLIGCESIFCEQNVVSSGRDRTKNIAPFAITGRAHGCVGGRLDHFDGSSRHGGALFVGNLAGYGTHLTGLRGGEGGSKVDYGAQAKNKPQNAKGSSERNNRSAKLHNPSVVCVANNPKKGRS